MKLKGQPLFIREYTRYLLAHKWCPKAIQNEGKLLNSERWEALYIDEAIDRGWISKKDKVTINQPGWNVAAAFLKR